MLKLVSLALALMLCSQDSAHADGVFRDCETCPWMVRLPAGVFQMGSPESEPERSPDEGPVHEVTMRAAFAIGQFEVTHGQFATFAEETSRQMQSCFWDPVFPRTADHPAICVTVTDAEAYATWLSQKTGRNYRLPTEAEWEYAARGSASAANNSAYTYGDDPKGLCSNANTRLPGCDDGFSESAPVGSFPANARGIHDLLGNAWEYTADCVTDSYASALADGAAVTSGDCSRRIIRGAGWYNNRPYFFRIANRGWLGIKMLDPMTGFRLVGECTADHAC